MPWRVLNGVISNTVVPQDKHFIQKIELSGTLPSHPHVPTSMSTQSALPTMTMNECELFISFLKSSSPYGHKSLFSFTYSPINKHHPSYFLLSPLRWMNKALCTASSSVEKERYFSHSKTKWNKNAQLIQHLVPVITPLLLFPLQQSSTNCFYT